MEGYIFKQVEKEKAAWEREEPLEEVSGGREMIRWSFWRGRSHWRNLQEKRKPAMEFVEREETSEGNQRRRRSHAWNLQKEEESPEEASGEWGAVSMICWRANSIRRSQSRRQRNLQWMATIRGSFSKRREEPLEGTAGRGGAYRWSLKRGGAIWETYKETGTIKGCFWMQKNPAKKKGPKKNLQIGYAMWRFWRGRSHRCYLLEVGSLQKKAKNKESHHKDLHEGDSQMNLLEGSIRKRQRRGWSQTGNLSFDGGSIGANLWEGGAIRWSWRRRKSNRKIYNRRGPGWSFNLTLWRCKFRAIKNIFIIFMDDIWVLAWISRPVNKHNAQWLFSHALSFLGLSVFLFSRKLKVGQRYRNRPVSFTSLQM